MNNMIKREINNELEMLATQFPVVTVLGPRQSGKTTLVRSVFPDKSYINLENPKIRAFVEDDLESFFEQYPDGAIIDEVQRVPDLLSYIQVIVDEKKQMGLFILTGSHQLLLHKSVSQSLAGRTALLTLLPLTIGELVAVDIIMEQEEYIVNGFYPRIYSENVPARKMYENYFRTYVERDVRELINIKDLRTFEQFIKLCAGRIGQELNYSSLSNQLGVSDKTLKEWISTLEASYVIVLLPPYFENIGKRLVKSPKLYFIDVGLASYLLDITEVTQLRRDPMSGHLFENLVIMELYKHRYNAGLNVPLYFYRDQGGYEIDIIYKSAQQLVPVEIKSAKTYHKEFAKNLDYFSKVVGEGRCPKKEVIYSGETQKRNGIEILNYKKSAEIFNN
jgi:predicted AAA+ superfamily ATPase